MKLIITACILFLLGAAIKYGKMYFLIAGFNTLSKSEKEQIDIDGIATLFRNISWSMSVIILLGVLASWFFQNDTIEIVAVLSAIVIGVPLLIIRSNSKKYRSHNDKN